MKTTNRATGDSALRIPNSAFAFVALGSNLGDSRQIFAQAIARLQEFSDAPLLKSSFIETAPVDCPPGSPNFLNAVAVFESKQSPEDIQEVLQTIEKTLKKDPPFRFGPRTIDLDILLYGVKSMHTTTLIIPHPKLHLRRFVVEPLMELAAGEIVHPEFDRRLKSFLEDVQGQKCRKTNLLLYSPPHAQALYVPTQGNRRKSVSSGS